MAEGALPPLPRLGGDFFDYSHVLTGQERESVARLRSFLEREVLPIADDYWERAAFPHHLIPMIAELGLFADTWPGTRRFDNSAVYRGWCWMEIARVDPSMTTFVGVHSGLAMGAIGVGGTREQHEYWLPKMASGEIIGAFALTEPLSGSDVARGLQTSARRERDTWVINGHKRWIGNATFSDIIIVMARDVGDGHVKAFIVDRDSAGLSAVKIEGKQSLRIVQNADIVLEDVRVPEDRQLVNITNFSGVAAVLQLTRAEVAWQALGAAMGAYENALAYAHNRQQFGAPIAARQLVQDLLARCLGNITLAMGMCVRVSQLEDAGQQTAAQAAMAKSVVTKLCRETVSWARELLGGNGIVLSYGVARYFADMEAIYTFEGTREMNSLIVGREITGISAFT